MNATDNRSYYDAFSAEYDKERNDGYHKLLDDQAAELVRRVGEGRDVLEVGCGTGLILERATQFAKSAKGIDLSPGMLERARARGLDVAEASATDLPFDDDSFDVAYSFKVLAHIPDLAKCLSEMARVVRPGGHIVFDAYNRRSLRYMVKRLFGPRHTSQSFDEAAITTRFTNDEEIVASLPSSASLESKAGIRVLTAHPALLRLPVVGAGLRRAEWLAMDSPLASLAGFTVFTARVGAKSSRHTSA